MKKHLIFLIIIFFSLKAEAQQITSTFPDTITLNQKFKVETLSFLRDNGPAPTYCSPLIMVGDTLIGNKVIMDLTFDFTGAWINGCAKKDTFEYKLLPQGNYQFICFWNRVDSTNVPPNNFPRYASDTIDFHVLNSTSIEERSLSSLQILPNPADDYIQIKNPNNISFDYVELWDIKGRKIRNIDTSKQKIDISELSKGIYFLKFINAKTSHEIKLFKL